MERRIAVEVDHVVAVSDFLAGEVVHSTGVPRKKVSVLSNVVGPERFAPPAGVRSANEILFVGRLASEKGLHVLLEALSDVPRAHLTVAGPSRGGTEWGGYERRCRRLAARLDVEERVAFLGPVAHAHIPALLQRCAVLAVPSIWGEPSGVVVLEGLACGTPIVASRVGGIPELIEHGRTGVLCRPEDRREWSRQLTRALEDTALRESCARDGPLAVAHKHTPDSLGASLVALYARVVESSGAGQAK